jgi:DNA-binding response OmpR family regulator
MRILIADDDPVTRKLMKAVLEREGHDVFEFSDGASLLVEYRKSPAPVVVTDWLMPGISGLDVCERIRETPEGPFTHIVVVTTLSPAEYTLAAFCAGVDDFIAKPFDPSQFANRILTVKGESGWQEENVLRRALMDCRALPPTQQGSLAGLLGAIAGLYRSQRAFGRCRAFLRCQLESARASGEGSLAEEKLRRELAELEQLEKAAA